MIPTARNHPCLIVLVVETLQSGYILAQNVKLQVDHRANLDIAEVGVLARVGYDGHGETVLRGRADRERHAVDGYRSLVDCEISAARHFLIEWIFKGEIRGAVGIFHFRADSSPVHVSLHNMSVQTPIHQHRTLYVDVIAHPEQPEIRPVDRFFHRRYRVDIAFDLDHCQANAVVTHTLIDLQFIGESALQTEIDILFLFMNGRDSGHLFYNTGKHSY